MTNYKYGIDDLNTIFEEYTTGTKATNTNYKNLSGIDLSNIFAPYVSGTKATSTNYKISTGQDLSDIFKKKTYLVSSLTTPSINGCR